MGPVPAGRFFHFYAPLAATSLLLTATNPLLAAALARSTDPATALAGYSVAFALCGVLYSPLLVVQQVTTKHMMEGGSFPPFRRFAVITGLVFTALSAAIAFTPMGGWVFGDLIGVTNGVYREATAAMRILWPVPFLTALRAAHQGRLVAGHRTRPIAQATALRTVALALIAVVLVVGGGGAAAGAVAFLVGLVVETGWVWFAPADPPPPSRHTAQELKDLDRELIKFSAPLMLNVLLWWTTPLIINGVLARTPEPAIALAAFAVIEALAWFIAAPTGQLQHASLAMVNGPDSHRSVRRWGLVVAVASAALLGLIALPGVREFVLRLVFDLEPQLLREVAKGLPLAALYPLLYAHRQYYQGLYVRAGRPGLVGLGAALRVGALVGLAFATVHPFSHHGVLLGVGLAVAGLAVEDIFLEVFSRRSALPRLKGRAVIPGEALAP